MKYANYTYKLGKIDESDRAFFEKVNPGFKCTGETLEESYEDNRNLCYGATTFVVFTGPYTPYGMCRDCGDHYIIARWDRYDKIVKGSYNRVLDVEDR